MFVSTQRVGDYAMWIKRRLLPPQRFAALILLDGPQDPRLFLLATTDWCQRLTPAH